MKILIDAMGGDLAPKAPVLGALQARQRYGCDIVLIGKEDVIRATLTQESVTDLPPGTGDSKRHRGCGNLRQPLHRLARKKRLLTDRGAKAAEKRRRRRISLRRQYRRHSLRRYPAGQADSGPFAGPLWPR